MRDDDEILSYGVFIIESMDFENEERGKLTGQNLKSILDLCDIPNRYYYVRTKKEFESFIDEFEKSNFKFLHISCHGNTELLRLTFDIITFEDLEEIIGHRLYHRRLFLSACQAATFDLAERFIPKFHAFSIIGTPDKLDYDKAAIFWSTFYYLMFSHDMDTMKQVNIKPALQDISALFKVDLNYFSIINNNHPKSIDSLREIQFEKGRVKSDQVRTTKFKNQFRESLLPDDVNYNSESS